LPEFAPKPFEKRQAATGYFSKGFRENPGKNVPTSVYVGRKELKLKENSAITHRLLKLFDNTFKKTFRVKR
jgi:hypothetical protein